MISNILFIADSALSLSLSHSLEQLGIVCFSARGAIKVQQILQEEDKNLNFIIWKLNKFGRRQQEIFEVLNSFSKTGVAIIGQTIFDDFSLEKELLKYKGTLDESDISANKIQAFLSDFPRTGGEERTDEETNLSFNKILQKYRKEAFNESTLSFTDEKNNTFSLDPETRVKNTEKKLLRQPIKKKFSLREFFTR